MKTTAFASAVFLASLLTGCSHPSPPAAEANSAATAAAARQQAIQNARANAQAEAADREELDAIPLPSKTVYMAIHTRQSWSNPFLIVSKSTVNLSMMYPQSGPASAPGDTVLRPAAARRREVDLRLSELPEALTALPPVAWPYGRVIAVEEDPTAPRADGPAVRRNVEATMQILSDLGIVAYEWQSSGLR